MSTAQDPLTFWAAFHQIPFGPVLTKWAESSQIANEVGGVGGSQTKMYLMRNDSQTWEIKICIGVLITKLQKKKDLVFIGHLQHVRDYVSYPVKASLALMQIEIDR